MATSTERFGFTKPAGSDPASVVPLNSNIDLIELYLGRTQDSIAPMYDDTETYSVGDLRTYESRLYKCNTDILTPETFDPEKWDLTTAVQEGGGGGSGASAIEKTQAEYDALTPAQKTNGAIYMVQAGEQPQDTSGTFVSGSAQYEKVEVNCGFRPDYIEVTLPFSSGDTTAIYDASVSTTTSTWEIPQESNKYTITLGSETGETGITDITDTGFKFRCNASNTRGVTCTFTASKEGQDAVNKIYYMGTEYANTNGGSGGGGNASLEATVLYDTPITANGTYTLADSYENYDFISIKAGNGTNETDIHTYAVDDLKRAMSDSKVITNPNTGGWFNFTISSNELTIPNKSISTIYSVIGYKIVGGGGGSGSSEAEDINYDNTTSQLTADNVQEAIDEVVANVGTASEDILTLQNVQGYDAYDETQTYAVGDYAIYNNRVYECTTAVSTAEPFDSTKWSQTSIEQIIDGVKGDVSQLNSSLTNKTYNVVLLRFSFNKGVNANADLEYSVSGTDLNALVNDEVISANVHLGGSTGQPIYTSHSIVRTSISGQLYSPIISGHIYNPSTSNRTYAMEVECLVKRAFN